MTHVWPETRHTLIARLRQPEDQVAWNEFVSLYEPLILRFAMRRGLQYADASDVCQRVLWSVARAVDEWKVGSSHGRFRAWLAKVTRNAVINLVQREAKHQAAGESLVRDLLLQVPDEGDESLAMWETEHAFQLLRYAAEQVRGRFQGDSWELFWRTTVDGEPIESVANELKKSLGAAYAIRSRILLAIREVAKNMGQQEGKGETS